jgi:hypothetical protein
MTRESKRSIRSLEHGIRVQWCRPSRWGGHCRGKRAPANPTGSGSAWRKTRCSLAPMRPPSCPKPVQCSTQRGAKPWRQRSGVRHGSSMSTRPDDHCWRRAMDRSISRCGTSARMCITIGALGEASAPAKPRSKSSPVKRWTSPGSHRCSQCSDPGQWSGGPKASIKAAPQGAVLHGGGLPQKTVIYFSLVMKHAKKTTPSCMAHDGYPRGTGSAGVYEHAGKVAQEG